MNSNLIFLYAFLIIFIVLSFFQIDIKGDYFLHSIINNNIWRFIILGIAIFIFGKKYIDELEKAK